MNKIILDTNAYSSFLAGDKEVLDILAKSKITYMSIFVLGELYAGFKGGTKELRNSKMLADFLHKPTVATIDATQETSEIFGTIKNFLKKAGTPLPINDIWIASHAVETGAVIVTYDKHFKKIAGLRIWDSAEL